MTYPISESYDRRSLSPGVNTEETGTREGAESRPREKERGAVPSSYGRAMQLRAALGRAYCLACGAPLGPELSHVGPPSLLGRIYASAT